MGTITDKRRTVETDMSVVPVGVIGKIVSPGDKHGWFVKVEDDSKDTGGFLILEWRDNPREGFDSWAESRDALDQFFQETGWKIVWSVNL
jgi:hypothetical protein